METLKKLRREPVIELHDVIDDKSKTAFVTVELSKIKGTEPTTPTAILVFTRHSEDIVTTALNEMDPDDTGYVFFASELEIDPINNCMVPLHRLATKDELRTLKNRNIPKDKLPMLCMLDPIRRWHNFKKGSVVTIERKTLADGARARCTAGDKYFRRVV